MNEDRKPPRLPPPVFPPRGEGLGGDAPVAPAARDRGAGAPAGEVDGAFYYPEEQGGAGEGLSLTDPEDAFADTAPEEGTATGIGSDAHLAPKELAARGDPCVMEVTTAVAKLAEGLRRRGEAGLHISPEMSQFEATLRGYCVGYLAGLRAESNQG